MFNTFLKTRDNMVVILPNGALSSGSMVNRYAMTTRRVEWTFSIAYGDDFDKAKAVILRLCDEEKRILKSPQPVVNLQKLNNSSVDLVVKAWVNSTENDYLGVMYGINEAVYKTFAEEGLNIPFPQVDVHMK